MSDRHPTPIHLAAYAQHLRTEERSAGTIEKYMRDAASFARWLGGDEVTRQRTAAWKEHLLSREYAPRSINTMLSALNSLLRFLGWEECRVKFLKIQRRLFRDEGRDLSQQEYQRLLSAARAQGKERLALLMEAICSTGVRVSEVRYLTVEAARRGKVEVALKGKIRAILDGAGVVWQTAELGKVDEGGGGTVAMFIANRNIDTLDIGVPVISMHAPFEVVSKVDVYSAYEAFKAFTK